MPPNTANVINLNQLQKILYSYLNSSDEVEQEMVGQLVTKCSQELTQSAPHEKDRSVESVRDSDIEKIKTKFDDCLWVCLMMACRSPKNNAHTVLLEQLESLKTPQQFDMLHRTELEGHNLFMVGVMNDLDVGKRLLGVVAKLEPSQQAQILQQTNVGGLNILCCVLEGRSELLPTLLDVISQIKLHQQAAILLHNGGSLGGNIISFCAKFLSLNHPALFELINKFDYPHRLEVFSQLDDKGYNILKYSIKYVAKQQISLICDGMSTLRREDRKQIFRQSIKFVTENQSGIYNRPWVWDGLLLAAFRLDMVPLLLGTICIQTHNFQVKLLRYSERCRLAVILSLLQQAAPIQSLTDILLLVIDSDLQGIDASSDVSKLSPFLRFYCAMAIKIRDFSMRAYEQIRDGLGVDLDEIIQAQLSFKPLPVEVSDDGNLMTSQIESNAFRFLHASAELNNNLTLVLTAINKDPEAWVYASFEILSSIDVANAATITDPIKRAEACKSILKYTAAKSAKKANHTADYSASKATTKAGELDILCQYRGRLHGIRRPVSDYSPEPVGEEHYTAFRV